MTVAPTSSTSNVANANAAANSATSSSNTTQALNKLSGDFNNFLTLLTTQLKNQDPLSPMDSTQFTQQLVAFTGVEQQINGNAKLDQLIALGKGDQLTAAAGFIGSDVQATSSSAAIYSDGTATSIGFTLPSDASLAAMSIYDSSGNAVRTGAVPTTQGSHVVSWDGKNDEGTALPAGTYSFSVQAIDANQLPISGITTSILGKVTNVSTDSSNAVQLTLGSVVVPLTAVTSINKATS